MRIRPFWAHLLIFAAYPVLSLYSLNTSEILPSVLPLPLTIYLGLAVVLYGVFYGVYRDAQRAALMVSGIFLVSMIFGQGVDVADHTIVGKYLLDEYRWIWGPFILLCLFIHFRAVRRWRPVSEITRALNVMAAVLLIMPVYRIARYYQQDMRTSLRSETPASPQPVAAPGRRYPDIYYIILDGYARQDILSEVYGYDNRPFIDSLKALGFSVLPQARSNYAFTYLSLSSALNMDYINQLDRAPRQEENCFQMIRQNQVMKIFNAKGYKTIHFKSGWVVTGHALPAATLNYDSRNLNQFNITLAQTSLLRFFVRHPFFVDSQRQILNFNLAKLKDVAKLPGPKLVFLHLVCPHPPFVFDRDGKLPPQSKAMRKLEPDWLPKERYVDQLHYLNGRVLDAVRKILQVSDQPPVIVLQSDHGPATDQLTGQPTLNTVNLRTSILNAYFLPGNGKDHLYPTITPVNSFRLILNSYLGESWPYLPDKTYFSGPIGASPYAFIDVTDLKKLK